MDIFSLIAAIGKTIFCKYTVSTIMDIICDRTLGLRSPTFFDIRVDKSSSWPCPQGFSVRGNNDKKKKNNGFSTFIEH